MTDEEVQVAVGALRGAADVCFPELAAVTRNLNASVPECTAEMGGAFRCFGDVSNGLRLFDLLEQFTEALLRSEDRLTEVQVALHQAADSYEDADDESALRVQVASQ